MAVRRRLLAVLWPAARRASVRAWRRSSRSHPPVGDLRPGRDRQPAVVAHQHAHDGRTLRRRPGSSTSPTRRALARRGPRTRRSWSAPRSVGCSHCGWPARARCSAPPPASSRSSPSPSSPPPGSRSRTASIPDRGDPVRVRRRRPVGGARSAGHPRRRLWQAAALVVALGVIAAIAWDVPRFQKTFAATNPKDQSLPAQQRSPTTSSRSTAAATALADQRPLRLAAAAARARPAHDPGHPRRPDRARHLPRRREPAVFTEYQLDPNDPERTRLRPARLPPRRRATARGSNSRRSR